MDEQERQEKIYRLAEIYFYKRTFKENDNRTSAMELAILHLFNFFEDIFKSGLHPLDVEKSNRLSESSDAMKEFKKRLEE